MLHGLSSRRTHARMHACRHVRTHARRQPRNLAILRKTERGACETTSATRRVWKWRAVAIVWKWIRSPLAAEATTVTNWLSSGLPARLPACLPVCLPTRNVAVKKAASLAPCLVKSDAYTRGAVRRPETRAKTRSRFNPDGVMKSPGIRSAPVLAIA